MVKGFRAAMDAGRPAHDPVLTRLQGASRGRLVAECLKTKWTVRQADHRDARPRLSAWPNASPTIPPDVKLPPAGREGHRRPRGDGSRRGQRRLGHGRANPGRSPRWSRRLLRSASRARTRGRGTFTHRRSVPYDQNREKLRHGTYMPLQRTSPRPERRCPRDRFDPVQRSRCSPSIRLRIGRSEHPRSSGKRRFGDFVRRCAGRHRPVHRPPAKGKWPFPERPSRRCCPARLPHEGQGPGA